MSNSIADTIRVPENGTWPGRLSFIVGVTYAIVGVMQISVVLGLIGPIVGFSDAVGGFMLLVVAAVFLSGVRPLSKDEQEGYAFVAVGFILAAILFGLQVLVIGTNFLGWVLQYQGWLQWNIMNDITPSLWLFLILMTATGILWISGNLREKLRPSSKEGYSK